MKRTAYVIEGQSFTEPSTLPDGFTVKTVEVSEPKDVTVESIFGKTLRVCLGADGEEVAFGMDDGPVRLFSFDSARLVRDCLNAILNETQGQEGTFKGRVFKDSDGDLWFELEPGLFTLANGQGPARRRHANGDSHYRNLTAQEIVREFDAHEVTGQPFNPEQLG